MSLSTTALRVRQENRKGSRSHRRQRQRPKYRRPKRWLSKQERDLVIELSQINAIRRRIMVLGGTDSTIMTSKDDRNVKSQVLKKLKSRWRQLRYLTKTGSYTEYSPAFIAKALAVHVAVVYRVLTRYGATGNTLFNGDTFWYEPGQGENVARGERPQTHKRRKHGRINLGPASFGNSQATGSTAISAPGQHQDDTPLSSAYFRTTPMLDDAPPLTYSVTKDPDIPMDIRRRRKGELKIIRRHYCGKLWPITHKLVMVEEWKHRNGSEMEKVVYQRIIDLPKSKLPLLKQHFQLTNQPMVVVSLPRQPHDCAVIWNCRSAVVSQAIIREFDLESKNVVFKDDLSKRYLSAPEKSLDQSIRNHDYIR